MENSSNFLEPLEELPSLFAGRERELSTIKKAFVEDQHRVVAVTGPTGVGKTALILTFASLFKDKFLGGIYQFQLIKCCLHIKWDR